MEYVLFFVIVVAVFGVAWAVARVRREARERRAARLEALEFAAPRVAHFPRRPDPIRAHVPGSPVRGPSRQARSTYSADSGHDPALALILLDSGGAEANSPCPDPTPANNCAAPSSCSASSSCSSSSGCGGSD
jgi:hypothetical protein